jgi:hypothetical protein
LVPLTRYTGSIKPEYSVEVKLGGDKLINEGAESLKKLAEKIDTAKMRRPAFMMVLCGVVPFAYKREDGVYVVPITCLKD